MDEQLRKRLEEAARDYAETAVVIQSDLREEYIKESMHDFKTGASFGYKEAIAQAKEWLKTSFFQCIGEDDVCWESAYNDITEALDFFETDMNKLLEEKK